MRWLVTIKKVTEKVNFANCEIHAKQGDANAQYNFRCDVS